MEKRCSVQRWHILTLKSSHTEPPQLLGRFRDQIFFIGFSENIWSLLSLGAERNSFLKNTPTRNSQVYGMKMMPIFKFEKKRLHIS